MSADLLKLIVETAMASTMAIIAVLALRLPLRRWFGARVAYALWSLVPLAVVSVLIPARKIVVSIAGQPDVPALTGADSMPLAQMAASSYASDIVLLLWIAGIGACALHFLRQQRNFMRSLGELRLREENVFLAENNLQGPSVVGVVNPRVVLPSDFESRYNNEERHLILQHEKTHLARGDTRVNLLAACLRSVFWFNPLVHWADGRFRFDQELSTDANVLSKYPSARKSYADAMLKTQMATASLPVACHWQAHHPLKERILMLKKPVPGKMFRTMGFALVAILCLGGAFAAWSSQPADIVAESGKAAFLYEARMDIDIDGDVRKDIVIREAPGKLALVTQGEGDKKWSFEYALIPQKNNRVLLRSTLKHGDEFVQHPELLVDIDKSIGLNAGDGNSLFKLNMKVSELRDANAASVQTDVDKAGVSVDKLTTFKKMAAQRESARMQNEPEASWRKALKISFIVDPRKPYNKDEGC